MKRASAKRACFRDFPHRVRLFVLACFRYILKALSERCLDTIDILEVFGDWDHTKQKHSRNAALFRDLSLSSRDLRMPGRGRRRGVSFTSQPE
jgi:hypothetical protein